MKISRDAVTHVARHATLSQYSLVSCGEIALKSSNIQSQKNNKICDLKYNLDFSYTERDTGVQNTPKSSSYIGLTSTL